MVRPLMVDRDAYGEGVADMALDGAYDMEEQIDDDEVDAAGEFEQYERSPTWLLDDDDDEESGMLCTGVV